MIKHKKGSLFEAPKGAFLVRACNTKGVWGAGIDAEFKRRFPKSTEEYEGYCKENGDALMGTALITSENVVCLFTSDYAETKEQILANTEKALADFFEQIELEDVTEFHSNKFNSGLFGVPWEATEYILQTAADRYWQPIKWTVWDNT